MQIHEAVDGGGVGGVGGSVGSPACAVDASAAEVDGLDEVGDASRRLQAGVGPCAHADVFKH